MTGSSLPPSAKREAGMSDKQIEKIKEVLSAALRKCRKAFCLSDVQVVLGRKDLTKRLVETIVATIKQLAEEMSGVVVRSVKPEYCRQPQEALQATGCKQYVNDEVVAAMPAGGMRKCNLEFVNFGKFISDDELEDECQRRNYARLASPYELAAANEAEPTFAAERPNVTHWKDDKGRWCYISFCRNEVHVRRDSYEWGDFWWFAFVR